MVYGSGFRVYMCVCPLRVEASSIRNCANATWAGADAQTNKASDKRTRTRTCTLHTCTNAHACQCAKRVLVSARACKPEHKHSPAPS